MKIPKERQENENHKLATVDAPESIPSARFCHGRDLRRASRHTRDCHDGIEDRGIVGTALSAK
jgi:hypothetical protein